MENGGGQKKIGGGGKAKYIAFIHSKGLSTQ